MELRKKTLKYLISLFLLLNIFLYIFIIFLTPKILNSSFLIKQAEKCAKCRFQKNLEIQKSNFKISPLFDFKYCVKYFCINENGKILLSFNNLNVSGNLFKISKTKILADKVYFDLDAIKNRKNNIKSKKEFSLSNLPCICIKEVLLVKNSFDNLKIKISDLNFECGEINTLVQIKNNYLPLINLKVYGNREKLRIKSEEISLNKAMASLLYYQKRNNPKKKFIENFYDFKGKFELDLFLIDKNFEGKIIAQNIGAKTKIYNLDLFFKEAVFNIKNNCLTSEARGYFAKEELFHKIVIENLFSSEKRTVSAELKTKLSEQITKKYSISNIKIKNDIEVKVVYKIKNNKIDVEYFLNFPQKSDIYYNLMSLGLKEKERKFYAHTIKDCNDLHLSRYDYSIVQNGKIKSIISGDGYFKNINNKLTPQWVSVKTNGYAPVSFVGSFNRYIKGGEFSGKLKYDFVKNKIIGNFEIIKTVFNDFNVDFAKVSSVSNVVEISAGGNYKNQKFNCQLEAQNRFDGVFNIYKMSLFIDKFIIEKNNKNKQTKKIKFSIEDISSKVNEIEITIQKWIIKVNEIKYGKIILKNVELLGSLKNSVFDFKMSELNFANGILFARGKYDFRDNSSKIDFCSKNIDSNIVADLLFNLKNQIQGIANAVLNVETKDNLQMIIAKGAFEITDGFLPQLGNQEFMIKKFRDGKKFKISDVINIDLTKKERLNSDIKGELYLVNHELKNVEITSQQKFMSLYLNGNYNIKKQNAHVNLYGKYNKEAPKGVKILFVPLNWILNFVLREDENKTTYQKFINKIPDIEGKKEQEEIFKIDLIGNLNTQQIKTDIKMLK